MRLGKGAWGAALRAVPRQMAGDGRGDDLLAGYWAVAEPCGELTLSLVEVRAMIT